MALLNLFDPETGMPMAIIDATVITDMRTGAMTAHRRASTWRGKDSKVLGHIGARGTAYWNVRLLDSICSISTRSACTRAGPESRDAFGERLSRDLGKPVTVDRRLGELRARRRHRRRGLAPARARRRCSRPSGSRRARCVMPYGTMSAVELSLTDIMDKMVVDDWGQCRKGLPFGALRAHVDSDRLTEHNLHAELGQIVAGRRSPAASATTRRSCSGTAACRCPTSRSAARCSTRRRSWGSDSSCASRDGGRASGAADSRADRPGKPDVRAQRASPRSRRHAPPADTAIPVRRRYASAPSSFSIAIVAQLPATMQSGAITLTDRGTVDRPACLRIQHVAVAPTVVDEEALVVAAGGEAALSTGTCAIVATSRSRGCDDADPPRLAAGMRADRADVAAQVDEGRETMPAEERGRRAVGCIFLADAAEVDLHPGDRARRCRDRDERVATRCAAAAAR